MPQSHRIFGDPLIQRLSQLLYQCLEDVGSTKACLYLKDPASQAFDLACHYGWPRNQAPVERLSPQDPLLVLLSREKRGFVVNDSRNFPELQPFSLGADRPRFYVSPVYDHGELRGLLLQRDPSKGAPYEAERQGPPTEAICAEIGEAMAAFMPAGPPRAEAAPHPEPAPVPAPPVPDEDAPTPVEDIPVIRVAAPPPVAMARLEVPRALPEGEALEQIQLDGGSLPVPPGDAGASRELPFGDIPQAEANAFVPEQQTFFWEAANLLCQTLPAAAVALWLNDATGARPLLIYSRFPLSDDLKHQILTQVLAQVPHVKRSDVRLLTRSEWFERDPIAGHFLTLLPVMLEGEVGGDDLLMIFRLEDRSFSLHEQDLIRQVARMLGFYLQEVSLHERYHQAFLSVSHRILASAETRIPAMRHHSIQIAELARELAKKIDLPTTEIEAVSISAILHDVGTLLLDYRILDKPRLTPDELAKVRMHPLLASTFLKDLYFPYDVLKIIRHHHERWDGTGYPDGLKGEEIPMGSRIIALAEAYEMMLSETPYRPAKTPGQAVTEMERLAGVQFDPRLVGQFIQVLMAP
jgi:HD-GYP domain-containing protein (c-di-GMP phosphodiesterase class II)